MSREIMQQALNALRLVGKYTDSLTCYVSTISEHEANIVDPSVQLAIAELEAHLAKPEQPELRKAAEMAIPLLVSYREYTGDSRIANKCGETIKALRQALEKTDRTSDSEDSFCKQELHNLMSVAGRMALELECLLLDTKDLSIVSKWWDTGMESLQAYRDYIWSITHGRDEIVALAQPEQEPVAWRYKICRDYWTYSEKYPDKEFAGDAWERWKVTPLYTAPPSKQKPVAYITGEYKGYFTIEQTNKSFVLTQGMNLYTAPPSVREWLSLTDEDITGATGEVYGNIFKAPQKTLNFARAVEAKLKEKNNG